MCFYIELQHSLQSWPSVKGSALSLIHIFHANSALISHAKTNHAVFPGSLATAPSVILRYHTVGEDSAANNTVILATLICK